MNGDAATNPVTNIYSTKYAFAAIKQDGSVITWGNDSLGGGYIYNSLEVLLPEDHFIEINAHGNLTVPTDRNLIVSLNSEIRIYDGCTYN